MKAILLVLLIVFSTSIFAQNKAEEDALWQKTNSYLRAINDDNRFELPTSEERKAIKKTKNLHEYATSKAYELLQILVKDYPNSKNSSSYFYHKGTIEYDKEMIEECKISLNKVGESENSSFDYYYINANFILAKIAHKEIKKEEGMKYLTKIQLHNSKILNRRRCANELMNPKRTKFNLDFQELYTNLVSL